MTFNDTLDAIIASINANTATLRSLLNLTQSGTIQPDDSETTPPPDYDEETGIWTLTQDAANGGVYEGVYRLAAASACAFLEIVSIVAYDEPSTGAPAQLRACATDLDPSPSMDDLLSLSALDGVNFSGFAIRSSLPYEIQVRITACIDGQCGDAVVEFVSATSSVTEGTSTHQVTVRLSLTGGETSDDITVDVGYGGTASNPADYTTSSTSVTFLAGSVDGAEQNITLTIVDDAVVESDESIVLTLSNPRGQDVELGEQVTHAVTLYSDDWCYSGNMLGWLDQSNNPCPATLGNHLNTGNGAWTCYAHKGITVEVGTKITEILGHFHNNVTTLSPRFVQASLGIDSGVSRTNVAAGNFDVSASGETTGTSIFLALYVDTGGVNAGTTLSGFRIKGKGTNPFGSSNC